MLLLLRYVSGNRVVPGGPVKTTFEVMRYMPGPSGVVKNSPLPPVMPNPQSQV